MPPTAVRVDHPFAVLVLTVNALVADAGRVITDRALLQRVWGPEYGSEDHYLHVYMARLRKKLERDPANPRHLRTEAGVGYRLMEHEAD